MSYDPYSDEEIWEIDIDHDHFVTIIVPASVRERFTVKEIYELHGLGEYYRTSEQHEWDVRYGWMTEEEKKRWGARPRPTDDEE